MAKEAPQEVVIAADQQHIPVPVVIVAADGGSLEKDPLLLDTDIARRAQEPNPPVAPAVAPQTTTTTTVTPRPDVIKGEGSTLAPTTTEQQDIITQGQREINKIWEHTQSWIALMVVTAGVVINGAIVGAIIFGGEEVSVTQLALMTISLQFINLTVGIVIGFYFSRTNHSAQGGVGPKVADAPYTGR